MGFKISGLWIILILPFSTYADRLDGILEILQADTLTQDMGPERVYVVESQKLKNENLSQTLTLTENLNSLMQSSRDALDQYLTLTNPSPQILPPTPTNPVIERAIVATQNYKPSITVNVQVLSKFPYLVAEHINQFPLLLNSGGEFKSGLPYQDYPWAFGSTLYLEPFFTNLKLVENIKATFSNLDYHYNGYASRLRTTLEEFNLAIQSIKDSPSPQSLADAKDLAKNLPFRIKDVQEYSQSIYQLFLMEATQSARILGITFGSAGLIKNDEHELQLFNLPSMIPAEKQEARLEKLTSRINNLAWKYEEIEKRILNWQLAIDALPLPSFGPEIFESVKRMKDMIPQNDLNLAWLQQILKWAYVQQQQHPKAWEALDVVETFISDLEKYVFAFNESLMKLPELPHSLEENLSKTQIKERRDAALSYLSLLKSSEFSDAFLKLSMNYEFLTYYILHLHKARTITVTYRLTTGQNHVSLTAEHQDLATLRKLLADQVSALLEQSLGRDLISKATKQVELEISSWPQEAYKIQ